MWRLFSGGVTLFFQGRLFADQNAAWRRIGLAASITAGVSCVLVLADLPVWIAAVVGGLSGGGAAPWLCSNLRMR